MKKRMVLMMIVVMIAVPAALFAGDGISLGMTAIYDTPLTIGEVMDMEEAPEIPEIDPEDLLYGAEVRLDLSLFQVGAEILYSEDLGAAVLYTNAGVYLDLGIIGFGAGAGPVVITDFSDAMITGYNVKATADLRLGSLILSTYAAGLVEDLTNIADEYEDMDMAIGASVLIQL